MAEPISNAMIPSPQLIAQGQDSETKPKPEAPNAKPDPAAAAQAANQVLQGLAGQYGVKGGDLSSEQGRAAVATDIWVKIKANLATAQRSNDPEAIQAALTAKSAFLDQLKNIGASQGWNFGLKELAANAPSSVDQTQIKRPVQAQASEKPEALTGVQAQVAALTQEALPVIENGHSFKNDMLRMARLKMYNPDGGASESERKQFVAQGTAIAKNLQGLLAKANGIQGGESDSGLSQTRGQIEHSLEKVMLALKNAGNI